MCIYNLILTVQKTTMLNFVLCLDWTIFLLPNYRLLLLLLLKLRLFNMSVLHDDLPTIHDDIYSNCPWRYISTVFMTSDELYQWPLKKIYNIHPWLFTILDPWLSHFICIHDNFTLVMSFLYPSVCVCICMTGGPSSTCILLYCAQVWWQYDS